MPINFIPNDPLTRNSLPMRQQAARPDRSAGRAGFNFESHGGEQPFDFGTDDFVFWQSREAALATVEAWEGFAGNLVRWANRSANTRRIDLSPVFDDGETSGSRRLNAFYDGQGVRFFDFDDGTETTFSGNSADTVSHEVGHALLDSQRPELFGSNIAEEAAFHEFVRRLHRYTYRVWRTATRECRCCGLRQIFPRQISSKQRRSNYLRPSANSSETWLHRGREER